MVIVPFLVVAFVVLYPWPGDTQRWFAWTIKPTMTPMILGSAYLGGALSLFFATSTMRGTPSSRVLRSFIRCSTGA